MAVLSDLGDCLFMFEDLSFEFSDSAAFDNFCSDPCLDTLVSAADDLLDCFESMSTTESTTWTWPTTWPTEFEPTTPTFPTTLPTIFPTATSQGTSSDFSEILSIMGSMCYQNADGDYCLPMFTELFGWGSTTYYYPSTFPTLTLPKVNATTSDTDWCQTLADTGSCLGWALAIMDSMAELDSSSASSSSSFDLQGFIDDCGSDYNFLVTTPPSWIDGASILTSSFTVLLVTVFY
jgi:hypothetical protein